MDKNQTNDINKYAGHQSEENKPIDKMHTYFPVARLNNLIYFMV